MLDMQQAMEDYVRGYQDKSRIFAIEKYLYTFNAMAGKKTPFRLFPRQRVFLETLADNRNVVSIKPRQCGITTLTSAWATFQCAYADPDAPETILCIGNKLDLAQQLITKIRDFLVQVPRYFWGEEYYSPDPRSEKNKKSIFIKDSKSELELFNGCRVIARSSGENAARGISAVSILILDEAAFIENGIAVYSTAAATMSSNPNSKTVMVSTPNGKDPLYYETYRQAMAGQNNFIAVQFRWYQDPRYNKGLKWYKKNKKTGEMMWDNDPIIDDTESVRYDEKRWEKLVQQGWTPISPWYEEMCKSFNNDKVKIAQELDVSFVGSSDNVIDPEYIEMQEKLNSREPLEDMKDPLVDETWFFKPPIDGHRYICSCLPVGERVLTRRGLVNVEDVQADDELVTKEGEFTKIKHRKYRDVEDEDVVEISLHASFEKFKFTWNHPIFSSISSKNVYKCIRGENGKPIKRWREWEHKFNFFNANEVKKDSWLQIPNVYKINKLEKTLDEIWDDITATYEGEDKVQNPLYNTDFWWYCGMWLAEGCVRKEGNYIQTTHNINETAYQERIKKLVNETFEKNCSRLERKRCNACDMVFYSGIIRHFLLNTFGHYADGKFISEWVKLLPEKYKLNLLLGYFDGDGTYTKNGEIRVSSISKKLIMDVQDILLSMEIVAPIKMKKGGVSIEQGKEVNRKDAYVLQIGKVYADIFKKKCGLETNGFENTSFNMYVRFNGDYIWWKVKDVSILKYSGRVYNFETESDSHTFCTHRIATHNCDPSRGSSNDYTAIEIIDMDGRDENDMPIVEQVMQYYGKKLGDEVGEILYNYATLYNEAHVIIDCTNGLGDVPLFALINKGYKNLYYDDSSLKKYSVQVSSKQPSKDITDVMPGFHMQGNRYPVLSNFANMVRNNEFKIRSKRTIAELHTWIFKGEAKRMDHSDNGHDDSITCLAMGLFVMIYSFKKMEQAQQKDKALLGAYMIGNNISVKQERNINGQFISNVTKKPLPFYGERSITKFDNIHGNFMWLFSGYK